MNAEWTDRRAGRPRLGWTSRPGAWILLGALAACGGGGGDGGGPIGGGSWVPGIYQPSSNFAGRCVAPRPGTGDRSGSATDENNFLRSWTNELYLWYREVPDLNPALYTTADYFPLLKTSATTGTGAAKDRFHFTYPTDVWRALSEGGQEVSYGLQWALLSTTPPRRAVIAYVEPNPPAATQAAGLTRGVEVLTVDGVDLVNNGTQAGVDVLNNGLFPDTAGETHTFGIRELNGTVRTVTLTAAVVTNDPVPTVSVLPTASGNVGYILFNDHIATAERELYDAINTLRTAAITDLVLDLRYNGGGYLDIASELAYMIAGETATAGRTFERLQFNDKYPNTNPVTGMPLSPTPFHRRSLGFSPALPNQTLLPTLNLPRVFVLTGNGTCSASESIINGLRGVGVQVIQIGNTTCGKPYGFYPQDNCGTTYFSIQFRGVNHNNFGDYADGFTPRSSPVQQWELPGCAVSDDFTRPLGDVNENRLEAALAYRETGGQCLALATDSELAAAEPVVPKSPWKMNRILRE
jgi:carboxyl-terminal processing protease